MKSNTLQNTLPKNWQTKQIIALGWHDGPTEGLIELAHPAGAYYFKMIAERFNNRGLDFRLFCWQAIVPGSVKKAVSLLNRLGNPTGVMWCPVWKFPNKEEQACLENRLDNLLIVKSSECMYVSSKDMENFREVWF